MRKPERKPPMVQSDYSRGWNACMREWEKWEKERPAKWLRAYTDNEGDDWYVCNNCGFSNLCMHKPSLGTCPECGRKMEE